MLARIADEDLLEIRTAYGQHDLVRLQQLAVTRERHVHQVTAIVQVLEAGGDVVLEVVPAQREFVVHGDFGSAARHSQATATVLFFFTLEVVHSTHLKHFDTHARTHTHTLTL